MDRDAQALIAIGAVIGLGGVALAVARALRKPPPVEARKPRADSTYGLSGITVTSEQEFSFSPEIVKRVELRIASGDGDAELRFSKGDAPVTMRAGAEPLILVPEKDVEQLFIAPVGASTKFDASVLVARRG